MNLVRNLVLAGAANVARYRLRSMVVVLCLVAICGPYVTGIAISEGIRQQAEVSVHEGADIYLTLDHFGRNGPVPLKYLEAFRASPYVVECAPRIVGRANTAVAIEDSEEVTEALMVIVGLEPARLAMTRMAHGSKSPKPVGDGQIVMGSALAEQVHAKPGQRVTLRVSDVTQTYTMIDVLPADASLWSAQVVCMTLHDAGELFSMPGYASDFLIYCRPGPGNIQAIRQDALDILGRQPYRIQTKEREVHSYVDAGFRRQQGIFTVLFLVAFAVGIPALLVASGLGLSERRREVGITKAVGWRTSDVIAMVVFEQVILSIISACLAVLCSYVWIRVFNGAVVAQFFISEVGVVADFQVPAQYAPSAPALALLLCFAITLVGSLYSTWRLATQPAADVLR